MSKFLDPSREMLLGRNQKNVISGEQMNKKIWYKTEVFGSVMEMLFGRNQENVISVEQMNKKIWYKTEVFGSIMEMLFGRNQENVISDEQMNKKNLVLQQEVKYSHNVSTYNTKSSLIDIKLAICYTKKH